MQKLRNLLGYISKAPGQMFIFIIIGLRPLLGPSGCCKYDISCGNYAVLQLQDQNIVIALFNIIKRVISCNPFL